MSMQEFLPLNHASLGDDAVITNAVALYAFYTAFNHFKTHSPCNSQAVKDFLERSTYHGVLKQPTQQKGLARPSVQLSQLMSAYLSHKISP